MAELLKYSFQGADFYRDSNGVAKLKNLGTLGSANDATLYTGQGLEFDGIDDHVPTDIVYSENNYKTFLVSHYNNDPGSSDRVIGFDSNDGVNGGPLFYIGQYSGYIYIYCGAYLEKNRVTVVSGEVHKCSVTFSDTTAQAYVDGGSGSEGAISFTPFVNIREIYLGAHRTGTGAASFWNGGILSFVALDATITDADALYDWENPEAIIEMAVTGVDNPNFSFSATNIKHCFTLDEGSGNTVYDIVTGNSYSMVNMPTDDTQWTNADQNKQSHQLARFKKDQNHNPSGPADTHTIRYD